MSNWWIDTGNRPSTRLAVEVIAMKKAFVEKELTDFKYGASWDRPFQIKTLRKKLHIEGSAAPYWQLEFVMQPMPGVAPLLNSSDVFKLQILYTSDFPGKEPQANYLSPDVSGSLHLFVSGNKLCLHNHSSANSGWDPARSTAATIAVWSIQWARAWLSWKLTGSWPEVQ